VTFHRKDAARNSMDGDGVTSPEDQIKALQSQVQALEIQLNFKSETNTQLSDQYELIQSKLREVTEKYEQEVQVMKDITKDMTRQYKGMQDDLLNKINARERAIQSMRDLLESQKRDFESCLNAKDYELAENRLLIEGLRIRMEELCTQFAQMLSNLTVQVKEKIELPCTSYRQQEKPQPWKLEEIRFD